MLGKKPFRDWSIRHKLTGLFVAMACITAFTIFAIIGALDLLGLSRSMARDLSTLAEILARNSSAALTFHDADAARDVLQALQAESSVTAACVYTADGRPFAVYVRGGKRSDFVPPPARFQAPSFKSGRLRLFHKIVFASEPLGTIYIESDLQPLRDRLRVYGLGFTGTLLVAVVLASFLGPSLQRPISRPLVELVQTADAISNRADYSVRATSNSQDEYGMLVSAFNRMLEQIQSRNDQLRAHREHLEDEVASRTAQLTSANARLNLQAGALNAASNSIVITNRNAEIVWSNPAFSVASGYSSDEVLGKSPSLVKSGKHGQEFYSQMWSTITSGNTWRGEIINRRKNGEFYTEEMTITPVTSQSGEITHFVAIKQDITERKRAAEALSLAEEKYRAIFEGAMIGIFQMTLQGRPISINPALAQMHGYVSPEEFLSEVSDVAQQLFVDPSQMLQLRRELERTKAVQGIELEIYRKDRTKKWVVANIRAAKNASGTIDIYEGTIEDITDRKVAEERVQFLAYYDALTGLPNRSLLQDRIRTALAAARRRKEKVAVLFLDLDRFKIINDTLGHTTGDLLLQEVAARLKAWAREQDTVARVGGDEFVVLLTSVGQNSDPGVAAQRIINALNLEYSILGRALSISTSIGISIFPQHGTDGEVLIKNADAAMYCAKQRGPNNIQFFSEDLNSQMVERLTLESGLRLALDRREFALVYQPQMEIATGKIIGLEALIRWEQPALGLVPPDKFIRIAENSGLIVPIGEWVLRTACAQIRKWHDEGLPALRIAVNVSAVQFRQDGFPDLIRKVLRETGLAPQYLELELTESLLLTNADVVFSVLQELNEMGLNLAIDDFGTGYSSLSYLKQFRVDKLKIDRSFIRDIAVDSDDAAITTAIINMAKSLNLKVIAEGVETEEQMSFLRRHHCDEIQGYYLSKPLSADDVPRKLISANLIAVKHEMGHSPQQSA